MIAQTGQHGGNSLAAQQSVRSGPDYSAFRFALACSRAPRGSARTEAIAQAAGEVSDWTQVLQVIRRHRIAGLANAALTGGARTPDWVRERLSTQATAIARANLSLMRESFRLHESFAAAGIPLAFLKGPVLSLQAYGDLGQRHSRDLDLMIEPAALADAARLLGSLGYRPAGDVALNLPAPWTRRLNQWDYVHSETRTLVELHWRFCPNARMADALSACAVWGDVNVGGHTLRTLTGDSLAAYLCLHGSLHAWSRLKWLADIDRLMATGGPDAPDRLIAFAERAGLLRPAAQALSLASTWLETPLSCNARRMLDADRVVGKLGATALRAMTTGHGATELEATAFGLTQVRLSHFHLGRGWRHWLAQARVAVASGEDRKTIHLPRALSFLYVGLRPLLWTFRRISRRYATLAARRTSRFIDRPPRT